MKSISDRLQKTTNDIGTSSQTQQHMLFELLNSKIEDLEEDGDLNQKAVSLEKDMDLIRKQRAIPKKDENKFAHAARWSSYYVSPSNIGLRGSHPPSNCLSCSRCVDVSRIL